MHTQSREDDDETPPRNSYLKSLKLWMHNTTPNVLPHLTSTAWHSYGFLFFRLVVDLSASGFGWLYFISQLSKVVTITLVKCYTEKHDITSNNSTCGTWFCLKDKITVHLFGSVGVLFFWPFLLAPCVGCMVNQSVSLMAIAYFFPFVFFSCFWTILGMTGYFVNTTRLVERTHKQHLENVLQSATHKSTIGLVLHLVTWVFLAHNKGKHISSETQSAFGNQTLFIVVTGFVTTVLYNLTSYDMRRKKKQRRKSTQTDTSQASTSESSSTTQVARVQKVNKLYFGSPWKIRCQGITYLVSVFVHVLSTNTFNIVLLLLPVYLIETMKANKLSVANFPTVVFGGFSIGSLTARKLIMTYGYKGLYCAAAGFILVTGIWFVSQTVNLSALLYFPALAFGFCSCLMIVTSHMMLFMSSQDLGLHFTDSDDFTRAMDELWNGFVVFVIMQAFPDGYQKSHSSKQTSDFLRIGMFYIPALHVIVGVIKVLSQFVSQQDEESQSINRVQDYVKRLKLIQNPVKEIPDKHRTIKDNIGDNTEAETSAAIVHTDLEALNDLPASNV